MLWLTWRQHRLTALMVALVLLALAAVLVATGLPMREAFQSGGAADCVGRTTGACADAIGQFLDQYARIGEQLIPWINFAPALLGVFVGAPLIAREIEQGTYKLVWTQAVSRRRWLVVQLTAMAALTLATAVAFAALMTWWRWPLDRLEGSFVPRAFDFEGPVVVAYFLCSFALGTAVGVVFRRVVVAMAVTLGAFLAIRLPIELWARPHYRSAITTTLPMSATRADLSGNGSGNWVLDSGFIDPTGHFLHSISVQQAQAGSVVRWLQYQPADRLATFQTIETAIFAGLAVLFMGLALAWVRWRLA
jgi:hypothetical protein